MLSYEVVRFHRCSFPSALQQISISQKRAKESARQNTPIPVNSHCTFYQQTNTSSPQEHSRKPSQTRQHRQHRQKPTENRQDRRQNNHGKPNPIHNGLFHDVARHDDEHIDSNDEPNKRDDKNDDKPNEENNEKPQQPQIWSRPKFAFLWLFFLQKTEKGGKGLWVSLSKV